MFGIIQLDERIYKMFAFTTQHVVIEISERTSDCPEPKTFQKISHKIHMIYPWRGEEIRDWPGLKDLALSWWIGARFFDAGEICELRLHRQSSAMFALCRKTTPNKERAAKPYKMAMNWAQVTQKK